MSGDGRGYVATDEDRAIRQPGDGRFGQRSAGCAAALQMCESSGGFLSHDRLGFAPEPRRSDCFPTRSAVSVVERRFEYAWGHNRICS